MILIAQYGLLIIFSISLVFHFLVVLKIVPYNIVWGGRLMSDTAMYRFETVSIVLNFLFLLIMLVSLNILNVSFSKTTMTIIFWIMAALFALNTVGNLQSKNKLEKILFTPITVLLTIFSLILALA